MAHRIVNTLVALLSFSFLATAAGAGDVDMEKELQGNLFVNRGNALEPYDGKLSDVKYYAIYSSAAWCGPCRAFTPDLVKFYNRLKPKHPEFEVVFRSSDRSEAAMIDYMKEDKMKWPALKFGLDSPVNRFRGGGIPCLVVVDQKGKVLSHSYVNNEYVGPRKVMEDLKDLLEKSSSTSVKSSSDGFFSK